MSRKLNRWGLVLLVAALVVPLGCGPSEADKAAEAAQAQEDAFKDLQAQKAALDAKRQELAEARAAAEEPQGEEASAAGEASGEETAGAGDDAAAKVAQLEAEVQKQSEDFYSALVEFINSAGLVEGEKPPEPIAKAIRMKSGEDMLVAEEYIDKGGNYSKAISIYKSALSVDPDDQELQKALADAEANRYMSEERFAQAKKGMTKDEVRAVLGTPFNANVRTFPKDKVEAWFYPVDPQGSAAAVWFRESGGEMKAYKVDYKEVVKTGPTEVTED